MSTQDTDRKIAVIFATDVVGYSKHMEKDEDATLASLNECNKIIEPIIKTVSYTHLRAHETV